MNTLATTPSIEEPQPGRRVVRTPVSQALAEGKLSRADLRALMQRSNWLPLIHLLLWIGVVAATSALVWLTMDSWWLWPAMFIHGVVLVHHFSLQHECTHYTAFKRREANDVVAAICGFIIMLGPTFFRYEHCDHHTYTQQKGRDPEQIPLPQTLGGYLLYISSWPYWRTKVTELFRHALGQFNDTELRFIPLVAHARVRLEARLLLALYAGIGVAMIIFSWWAPVWYWIIPVLLGEPVMRAIRMTEHVGMQPVADMHNNTRTSLAIAPLRWLAWNMPFHAEHHYASSVPYHALPRMHRQLHGELPVERGGYLGAHRDMLAQILGKRPRVDAPGRLELSKDEPGNAEPATDGPRLNKDPRR